MSELLKKDPRNAYALAASEGLKPEQLIIEQYAAGMTIRYIAAIFHKRRLFISAIVQPVFGKVASGNHCRNISNDCVRATYIGAGQRSTRKTAKLLGVSADTISRRLQQTIDGYLGS
ncbi:hypothetical protein DWB67_05555 [Paracoccus sp. JM45]|nr:hypothetical protein DWB67_05555 [Paracoccus sp. JM45]